MSMFGDLHQLSAGLEQVKALSAATEELTGVCIMLNANIEKLIAALTENNKLLKAAKKVPKDHGIT